VSKLAGEHYCRVYARVFGVQAVILRYFNVFGPRQDPNSQYAAVIPRFITAALDGLAPTVYGDGEPITRTSASLTTWSLRICALQMPRALPAKSST